MDTPHAPHNPVLVEDLTERELDVLRLKAQNRSNQEIADELVLALSTVKWYVRQVYGKLGVENQRQAVARAQAIGLIEGSPTPGFRPRHNLPAQTTPFIGREQELAKLNSLLAKPDTRLITILAAGGMGKTRLGLALAEAHVDRFADGVFMVPLAPLRFPDQIVIAVAEATYFPFSQDGRSAKQQVLDFLHSKHMLLLLDNFEHLLDGAGFVTEILQAAPAVQIVVTTRERLNLSGETVYNIGGMIFPDWETPEDALEYDAVKLFRQRAEQVGPSFEIRSNDLRYLARICRLVEGMPLGIVLAAAWTEVLSLEEIADEIQHSFDFLEAEMRDVPRRQWSIRAVFEPTWNQLTDAERDVFMRFSVFRGGATRDAAQTVTGADLRTLQALINKALLDRDPAGRYQMHELLRQYAEQQLEAANLAEETDAPHSGFFLGFLRDRADDVKGQRQLAAMSEIEADFENVRVAWQWAVEHSEYDALHQAAVSLGLFGDFGSRGEGVRSLFRLAQERLHHPGKAPAPGWVQLLVCYPENETLTPAEKIALARESLTTARQYGDAFLAGCALCLLRTVQKTEAPPDMAALHTDTLTHWQSLDDPFGIGWVLNHNAIFAGPGYQSQRKEMLQSAVDINRAIGNDIALSIILCNLGWNTVNLTGNYAEAKRLVSEAVDLSAAANSAIITALAKATLSHFDVFTGDFEEAYVLLESALAISAEINHLDYKALSLQGFAMLAGLEGDYDEAQQLCEQIKSLFDSPNNSLPFFSWVEAVVSCGLADYQAARRHLSLFLEKQIESRYFVRETLGLSIAAILRGQTGDLSGAADLLGLAFTHPMSATGWIERWELLTQFRTDLEADLGSEAYQAAWERGAALDLETIIAELIEEFTNK